MSRHSSGRPGGPLILLPPSKGKARGGHGPAYADVLQIDHPLADARSAVLAALSADLPGLDDRGLTRVAGVRRTDLPIARRELAELPHAATLPAHRRYTGVVHGNAGLATVDPAHLTADVRIVSALLGLAELCDPVPPYRLEFSATLASIGGIGPWWRERVAGLLQQIGTGRRVWDLLPTEHARIWDPAGRADLEVVDVAFRRPDGGAANAARAKVCKGRLTGWLLEHPTATPAEVRDGFDPGPGWSITADDQQVTTIYHG